MKRVIWIVLDSVGMGEMQDAKEYGDVGVNTIGNVSKALGGLHLPNLVKLGLGNIDTIKGVQRSEAPIGCYGRLEEVSKGKDTTVGHWEMVGVVSEKPFPTYPNGFPRNLLDAFEEKIGRKVIGNKTSSGTEILDELGEEHLRTGHVIVYTSADSVFQIAANEEIVPLEELYKMCTIAREMLIGEHAVARVIARPFVGKKAGSFTRTPNRRDFSLVPPYETTLDKLKNKGLAVMAVGKIEDIFSGAGITEAIHTQDNSDGVDKTLYYMKQDKEGLIFTNLVDFDMKWGHRNDYKGYGEGLEAFDRRLPEILEAMREEDILFITADHGCDPTTPGTDHTREYVPLIAYGKGLKENVNLATRLGFSDIGQTVCDIFQTEKAPHGRSFLQNIIASV